MATAGVEVLQKDRLIMYTGRIVKHIQFSDKDMIPLGLNSQAKWLSVHLN